MNSTRAKGLLTVGLIVSVLSAVLVTSRANAQSMYDDSKGKTSLLLSGGQSFLGLNTGDSSIQVSIVRLKNDHWLVWGGRVKGRLTDGVSKLLTEGKVNTGVSFDGYIGKKIEKHNSLLALRGAIGRESLALYDPSQAFGAQIKKETFVPWELGLNFSAALQGDYEFLLGAAAGVRRFNNYTTLESVKVTDTQTTPAPDGSVVRSVAVDTSARSGDYREGTAPFIDVDVLWKLPAYPITARVLGRFVFPAEREIRGHSVGIDLSLVKNNEPTARLLGVVFMVDDVFKQRDSSKPFSDRFSISLVANLPFSFFAPGT